MTKLPRPEVVAFDAGTAACELHAPEVARRRSGAWRRVRQRKAARVAGLGRTSRGDLNPGLTGENRRRWRPVADGGNPL